MRKHRIDWGDTIGFDHTTPEGEVRLYLMAESLRNKSHGVIVRMEDITFDLNISSQKIYHLLKNGMTLNIGSEKNRHASEVEYFKGYYSRSSDRGAYPQNGFCSGYGDSGYSPASIHISKLTRIK